MSIVEKAVEKLTNARAREPDALPRVEPVFETVSLHSSPPPMIERIEERVRAAHAPKVEVARWHISSAALKQAGLLPDSEEAASRLADELRRVKRPLLRNLDSKGGQALHNGHRIMVASALPGEGKTFTAFNLALSLAKERDLEVLLVDADVPKYDITRILKLESRPGLMDVLSDETRSPTEVIVRTDVPNLMVVPVGKRDELVAELFGSRRMEEVLLEFAGAGQRRVLLFDSSPLLAAAEAPTLATLMGQILVVVAAGRTEKETVAAALQALGDSASVGLVLNMSRLPAHENYYYGYYHAHAKER
ncbi:MAG: AAA family ATPase [Gammaproteobacteria bacterium]